MSNKSLTIVLPVHNGESQLAGCVTANAGTGQRPDVAVSRS